MSLGAQGRFVKSFVPGLDDVILGFPRGGLILVSGLPGSGKTSLGMSFIYNGALKAGEPGIYVSTYESRERFIENARSFGMDFEKLEERGLFEFISLPVLMEVGVAESFNMVVERVEEMGARRLVIDSFTALRESFKSPHEARILLQSVLYRVLEKLRCTTMLIKERASAGEDVGFEDYVADAAIHLEATLLENRAIRILSFIKLRGGEIRHPKLCFTLSKGFRALPPTKPLKLREPISFSPPPDPPEGYTTGIPDLDREIGGYPKGATVLMEIDPRLTPRDYHSLFLPAAASFIHRGRFIIGIPSGGVTVESLMRAGKLYGVSEEKFLKHGVYFIETTAPMEELPNIIRFDTRDFNAAFRKVMDTAHELAKKFHEPPFIGVGVDRLVRLFGLNAAANLLAATQDYVRQSEALMIWLVKPIEPGIVERLAPIADMHIKITRRHGCVIFYGVKPGTPIYGLQIDPESRTPLPEIIPIV
jgi:KaiC/GvpD/RAD55 family RecA-like ATPase